MTKRLILMRHAKSDWGSPDLADHDRPLNKRGRASAPAMADWLREQGYVPDRILCSSAVRTQQTAERMLPRWDTEVAVHTSGDLYLASPERILNSICSDSADADCVMVLAHNPGMQTLVSHLSEENFAFPTAAVAVFELDIDDWSQWRPNEQTRCVAFQRPKAL
ncbi:SixA phosphatase family protein [Roseimaritima ulvae]|uniref:Phosphohistidine phosphatase n=1 Tax=Roseimaritima ulvae TaxID=980254 RepID=A0A5B9R7L2_9BACT|nr:histidine phosphatase family protein [Roseimaritima ulvae]QEG42453.1 phosphohistidine phosphatase [Roseimaritima ulvae]